jgi:hypothetical protein
VLVKPKLIKIQDIHHNYMMHSTLTHSLHSTITHLLGYFRVVVVDDVRRPASWTNLSLILSRRYCTSRISLSHSTTNYYLFEQIEPIIHTMQHWLKSKLSVFLLILHLLRVKDSDTSKNLSLRTSQAQLHSQWSFSHHSMHLLFGEIIIIHINV